MPKYKLEVGCDHATLKMFADLGVPKFVAHEMLSFMYALDALTMASVGIHTWWNLDVYENRVEAYTEANGVKINAERKW